MPRPSYEQRKKWFDRVQEILAENQPMIFLASPDILVGAKNSIGNFHPAVLEPYVLWNVEQLYFKNASGNAPPMSPVLAKPEKKTRSGWDDTQLVKECLAGNEEAWSLLIDKYKALIYSIPVKYGLPPHEAADVFQSTCMEMLTRLPELREPKALPKWLMQVAHHQCYRRETPGSSAWSAAMPIRICLSRKRRPSPKPWCSRRKKNRCCGMRCGLLLRNAAGSWNCSFLKLRRGPIPRSPRN